MQARTSIIAAANFNEGVYCKTKSFNQNTVFNQALLSRFDLVVIFTNIKQIFLLLDQNNRVLLLFLTSEIRWNKTKPQKSEYFPKTSSSRLESSFSVFFHNYIHSLESRLSTTQIKTVSVPRQNRENIHPVLSQNAKKTIKDYYIRIRSQAKSSYTIPPTIRQLESLIRLTEARARADLRTEATEEDAQDVIDVIEKSMCDLQLALSSIKSNSTGTQKTSNKTQYQNYIEMLRNLSTSKGDK
ncbi:hypothetical protein MXB_3951, partial [Myxobolus squamalis]